MRVSVLVLVWVLSTGVFGCGIQKDMPLDGDHADDAVMVKMQGVIARQYAGADLRFEVHMGSVVLRKNLEQLDASGPIRGILFEQVWKNRD